LWQEVKPEDVGELWGDSAASGDGWDDDWGSGFVSLSDEIAAAEEAKDDAVKAYEADMMEVHSRWLADRESTEEAEAVAQSNPDGEVIEAHGDGLSVVSHEQQRHEYSIKSDSIVCEGDVKPIEVLPPHRRHKQHFPLGRTMFDADCTRLRFDFLGSGVCCVPPICA